jgi:hypothetical protein
MSTVGRYVASSELAADLGRQQTILMGKNNKMHAHAHAHRQLSAAVSSSPLPKRIFSGEGLEN